LQAPPPLGHDFSVGNTHSCVRAPHAFLDMLDLPALHFKVSVYRLAEQIGAVASSGFYRFLYTLFRRSSGRVASQKF